MLNDQTIRAALEALGKKLRVARDVEILIVGGAAGVLTGELPASWTTSDVDLLNCHLPGDRDAVLDAAAEVTRDLELSPGWLNDFGGLFAWTLPDGWQTRRVLIGTFNHLQVFAASRIDLITMKFLAHRGVDADHLTMLQPTPDERTAALAALDIIELHYPQYKDQIMMARAVIREWKSDNDPA